MVLGTESASRCCGMEVRLGLQYEWMLRNGGVFGIGLRMEVARWWYAVGGTEGKVPQVIFSDEMSIVLPGGESATWTKGERATRIIDQGAPKELFWAALGSKRSTTLVLCSRVNAATYCATLQQHLLPLMRCDRKLIFQQVSPVLSREFFGSRSGNQRLNNELLKRRPTFLDRTMLLRTPAR